MIRDLQQLTTVCFYNSGKSVSQYLLGLRKRSNVQDLGSDHLIETYEAIWLEDKSKIQSTKMGM